MQTNVNNNPVYQWQWFTSTPAHFAAHQHSLARSYPRRLKREESPLAGSRKGFKACKPRQATTTTTTMIKKKRRRRRRRRWSTASARDATRKENKRAVMHFPWRACLPDCSIYSQLTPRGALCLMRAGHSYQTAGLDFLRARILTARAGRLTESIYRPFGFEVVWLE